MQGYGQFCPVAQTMEIIGERWTLLVVRELLCGSRRFVDLTRGVPLMSRTMLSARLKSLVDAGVIERRKTDDGKGHEYTLTEAGEELRPIVEAYGVWGQRWARRDPRREKLDAGLLMWDMRRNLRMDALPEQRTVVEFRYRGAERGKSRFWLITQPGEADICMTHPGFEVDLLVQCHLRTMTLVWMGDIDLASALRSKEIELEGPRKHVRDFPKWLGLSMFASVERPA